MSYRMGAYILAAAPGERMAYQAKDITEEEAVILGRSLAVQMGHKAFGLIAPERSVGLSENLKRESKGPQGAASA